MIYFFFAWLLFIVLGVSLMYIQRNPKSDIYKYDSCTRRNAEAVMAFFLWMGVVLVYVVLAGFRTPNVGSDTQEYIRIFLRIYDNRSFGGGIEAGFVMLNRIVASFTNNPQVLLVVCAIFIAVPFVRRISTSSFFIPFSLSMAFAIMINGMNAKRTVMAIALVFFCMEYAKKTKWVICFVIIAFAVLFHISALIFIPVFWLCGRHYKGQVYILFAISMILISFIYAPIFTFVLARFAPVYLHHIHLHHAITDFSIVQAIMCSIYVFLCYVNRKRILEHDPSNVLYINLTFLFFVLTLFGTWIPFWNRFSMYFQSFMILIIPVLVNAEQSSQNRFIYYSVIWAMTFIFSIGLAFLSPGGTMFYNYGNVLFN